MWFEIADIAFFIYIKQLIPLLRIQHQLLCLSSSYMRSFTHINLKYIRSRTNNIDHLYHNHQLKLWNLIPPQNLDFSPAALHQQVLDLFWLHFISNFQSDSPCSFYLNTCELICRPIKLIGIPSVQLLFYHLYCYSLSPNSICCTVKP